MKKLLLVLFALLIGCGIGAVGVEHVSAQSIAPNPEAPRWQHSCHSFEHLRELEPRANQLGAEGWELVTVHSLRRFVSTDLPLFTHIACFKRPAPSQQPRQQHPNPPSGVDDPFN